MRPLILISNDDGIESAHLHAMIERFEAELDAELLVVAPERERSAMSQTITLHKPLRIRERAPGRYAASGTPVDCVYIGLVKMAPRPVSLVVSGINRGLNVGTDVFYSGTVGAALEGGLRGVPAIAVSLDARAQAQLPVATKFTTELARRAVAGAVPPGQVLNVNVPPSADGRFAMTRLGVRNYEDDVHHRRDPRGKDYYWIGGGLGDLDETPGTDTHALLSGVISVSPLTLDLTAHPMLDGSALSLSLDGFSKTETKSS